METQVIPGDPMVIEVAEGSVEEGMDLLEHCADSDSDSGSRWVSRMRSHFWYEDSTLRNIPDYRELVYPWDEKGNEGNMEEKGEQVLYVLKVRHKSWESLSDNQWKRGRWEELGSKFTPDSQERVLGMEGSNKCTPASRERVLDSQLHCLCTSAEVLTVRMEMHKLYEDGLSYRRLFRSKANRNELHLDNPNNEPYLVCVKRLEESGKCTYAHVFPKPSSTNLKISFQWLKPTTFDGDKQYIEFFHELMKATEYGMTKDRVLATAIVLANKSFQKMLRFQVDFAVEDCLKHMENQKRMDRRCDIYYFAAVEIVLNGKEWKSVVKSIKDGYSGLPIGLTEFGTCTDFWDGVIEETVDCIVTCLRSQRECGQYVDWVCNMMHEGVAAVVYEAVVEKLGSCSHLYSEFLIKKMKIARDLGLLADEDIILE